MSAERSPREPTLISVVNVLLARRRIVVVTPLIVTAVVIAIVLLLPRKYAATVAIAPHSPDQMLGRFGGLAAQLGFDLAAVAGGESPDFYADVMRSREILTALVEDQYAFVVRRGWLWWRDSVRVDDQLLNVLEIREDDYARRREIAAEKLRDAVSVSVGPTTGIVRASVQTKWPVLSFEIANRLLMRLQEFNLQTRRTQAHAERQFVEARLDSARVELRGAEDELQRFLQRNRDFTSPELQFQRDRLSREVTLRQTVYTSLAQAYEQARIDEVRNTPVFTLLEAPEHPARPTRRRLPLKALVALMVGGVMGLVGAFMAEAVDQAKRDDPAEAERFQRLRRDAFAAARRAVGSKRADG